MGRKPLLTDDTVLRAVKDFIAEHQMPPTIAELRDLLGVGSTRTVLRYLQNLEGSGAIRRWPGARGMQIARRK